MMFRRLFSFCSAVLFCTAIALPARAAITYNTVALSGPIGSSLGYGPNVGAGIDFATFVAPVINKTGQVAFGSITSSAVNYHFGIWTSTGISPTVVASNPSPGPNLGAGVNFTGFHTMGFDNTFGIQAVLSDDGQVHFIGKLSGTGINFGNDRGIWSSSGGANTIVARKGAEPGPGLGAGIKFDAFAQFTGGIIATGDAGRLAFPARLTGTTINSPSASGIWTSSNGVLELVVRAGSEGPSPNLGDGIYFYNFHNDIAMNPNGQVTFRGEVLGPGINGLNEEGIWISDNGSMIPIARSGTTGLGPNLGEGIYFDTFEAPAVNAAGNVVFEGWLSGTGVDSTNNTGIWTNLGGTLIPITRKGSAELGPNLAPGVTFLAFNNPVINASGNIAFLASLQGPGIDASNQDGIWLRRNDGTLSPIAREGASGPGPGLGDGVYFNFMTIGGITTFMNENGEIVFFASLTGEGVNAANNGGIWAWTQGRLINVLREGDEFDINPDPLIEDLRIVQSAGNELSLGTGSGGGDGRPTLLNDDGLLVFGINFTDGSRGVFTAQLPRQPGDFDNDGDVDGADFVAWQTHFPTASGATLAMGDADRDGDVDGADFVVWQSNFPFTPGPAASPVPEPAAGWLALLAGSALVLARSWQCRSATNYSSHARKCCSLVSPELFLSRAEVKGAIGCFLMLLTLFAPEAARGATSYTIRDISLNDAEHTRNDGGRSGSATDLNQAGQVLGRSSRYNGGSASLGLSTWLYNGTTTLNIGLTDVEHTRNDGYKWSQNYFSITGAAPRYINEAGHVVGYAIRFNGGSTELGRSMWLYNGTTTVKIGLTDAEHTSSIGSKMSQIERLNEEGHVIGISTRYSGGSSSLGYSAWFCDGTSTFDIGLTGLEHTSSNGSKYSEPVQVNESGFVIGESRRYNGGSGLKGDSAWLYNGSTTIDIGLTGPEYTEANGTKESSAEQLNNAGQVIGTSNRYNGYSNSGKSAWLYNGTTRFIIGLTDAEHTANDGSTLSEVDQLNQAGHVTGYSDRFGNSFAWGVSAWFYNGTTTLNIGLTDAEHTRSDGYKFSRSASQGYLPGYFNEAGDVVGYAARFDGGSTDLGRSMWLYDGTATIKIGLTDAEHTRDDGYKYSVAGRLNISGQLNSSGQVAGYSYRYDGGSTQRGQSAWLFNGTTTVKIGLIDTEHTSNAGDKFSNAEQLNEVGQVIGHSLRYNGGGGDMGRSTWLYNGSATLRIGLTDTEHTRMDGYKSSSVTIYSLNNAGQVIGLSNRFGADGSPLGQDAWVYDPILGTVSLQLSVRDDGYAYSEAALLGEDGVVLGSYYLYDGMTLLAERALYWSRDEGLRDLGQLVAGGLDDNGWRTLYYVIQSNALGQIIGNGAPEGLPGSAGLSAFLLTRVSIPGDFDSDGDVDGADFVAWQTHFPTASGATLAMGDADRDGDVDGADFVVWQTHFPTNPSGAAAVPEPAAGWLALVALIATGCLRRRYGNLRC